MSKTIAGREIDLNEEGYLTDFSQWTEEVGQAIAEEEGIALTDRHWEVIRYLQEAHQKQEALSIRGPANVAPFPSRSSTRCSRKGR
ncbi:MAG: TusE/DsrC/DsvC family sulfur relay protein [Pirellulaceae bacterium]